MVEPGSLLVGVLVFCFFVFCFFFFSWYSRSFGPSLYLECLDAIHIGVCRLAITTTVCGHQNKTRETLYYDPSLMPHISANEDNLSGSH